MKNYDISSLGEITSKKSSSFLRGPRVPIMLTAFPLWTVIEKSLENCSTNLAFLKELCKNWQNNIPGYNFNTVQISYKKLFWAYDISFVWRIQKLKE